MVCLAVKQTTVYVSGQNPKSRKMVVVVVVVVVCKPLTEVILNGKFQLPCL